MAHKRGMNEQHVAPGSSKGKSKHQHGVQSERTHVVIAVERAVAMVEIFVGDKQGAAIAIDVLDDILIAAVGELVDDDVAVAGVEVSDERPLLLGNGMQIVIDV